MDNSKGDIEDLSQNIQKVSDQVNLIIESLRDFWIPVNISHREDEIENLVEKLNSVKTEFEELK